MLEVQNLSVLIENQQTGWTQIIKDINFSISTGEVLAIIGESGSGKTMTGLSLLRLLPQSAAFKPETKILLHDVDLLTIPEKDMQKVRGADIAMIFQEPMNSLNPIYTAGQQVVEVLNIHRKMYGQVAINEALRLLDAVQIGNPLRCFNSYPHELSGGMQQRVMIAMALACKPSLLIADEPTTALDVTTQAAILSLLRDLQREENMAMLLITHDLAIAWQMADRIAVMHNGNIVEQNAKDQFFISPKDPYTQKLLKSTPAELHFPNNTPVVQEVVLEVQDLQIDFPIKRGLFRRQVEILRAVDKVSFNLLQGQTTGIVGESGSGKSTVAKAILGLNPLAQGAVLYKNLNLLRLSPAQWRPYRSIIQIIFQDPYSSLNAKLPILESLQEGMRLQKKYTTAQMHDKIDALLTTVGLKPEYKWRYPHEFSGGERQRICIARALTVDPKIIICDEPTSSLDVSVQAQILELLLKLQREQDLTYLFITHDLNLIRLMASHVVVMKEGRIVEEGSTTQIFADPKSPYTQELLNAMPKLPQIS